MTSARGLVRSRWPIVLRDFLSSRSVGVVARVDAGDNRIFRCHDASGAGERHVGGSGESGSISVERVNDTPVIPQWGCATSTATRSLLHVPSSAPSTVALDVVDVVGDRCSKAWTGLAGAPRGTSGADGCQERVSPTTCVTTSRGGDGASSGQAGDWAACLMRLVSSVT